MAPSMDLQSTSNAFGLRQVSMCRSKRTFGFVVTLADGQVSEGPSSTGSGART